MFFQKKPKQYIPQTATGENIIKCLEILTKIEEMKRNKREEMKQKKIELIKRDTNGVLQEQSFKPSEGLNIITGANGTSCKKYLTKTH